MSRALVGFVVFEQWSEVRGREQLDGRWRQVHHQLPERKVEDGSCDYPSEP